ncbi:homing endonuclease [Burkholderia phage Bm1]
MAQDLDAVCYVYCYYFPNGKRYFGIAKDVANRHQKHWEDVMYRPRALLHKMWIKYGMGKEFQARVVFTGTRYECMQEEIRLISMHRTNVVEWGEDAQGYNTSPGGDDHLHSAKCGAILRELLDTVPEFADWAKNRKPVRRKARQKA